MKQLYMQSETPKNIRERNQANHSVIFCRKTNRNMNPTTPLSAGHRRGLTITENLCKGPPGRPRSPGMFRGHPPDGSSPPDSGADRVASPLSSGREGQGVSPKKSQILNAEFQFLNHTNTKFYSQLNFTIMKKLFFILILAVFASAYITQAQTTLNPSITNTQLIPALSCAANANFLHPLAGVSYTYQMDGTTGAEDVSQWTWFATKNPAFITAGVMASDSLKEGVAGQLLAASSNYGKASANNNVQITWSPDILKNTLYQGAPSTTVFPSPTFVVGYGTGQNCADNIKVYEINPILNFTIDIAAIDPATGATLNWDAPTQQCVDKVQSATYVDATNDLLMNYGTNSLTFEVAAANFAKDFTPTFRLISGLSGVQTAVVTLHSTRADALAGANPVATTNWTAASVGTDWALTQQFTAANTADIVKGVSLFVHVVITNSTFESLAANPFVLAVDAKDNTNTGIWDMEDADCTTLADAADQIDQATHTINPRPTITGANVPDSNTAEPNNIVPKNP